MKLKNKAKMGCHRLREFYLSYAGKLYNNATFREEILRYNTYLPKTYYNLNQKRLFKEILMHYLEEAELTLSLIKDQKIDKKKSLLEVGGGIGFVYGFLKHHGFNISSIEPSSSDFKGYYQAGVEMFK